MALMVKSQIERAQAMSQSWADRNTPFIFDEWYVAALGEEISSKPLKRTLLGRDIALFKTAAGKLVALDDRCVHRSFPLSMGRVDGETLVCGYHGMRYDTSGQVVEIPSQPRCPSGIGVRQYMLHQIGPLVWIWMGDSDQADPTRIPGRSWMYGDGWTSKSGYMHMNASYVGLHENLLDLTHLSYLHANSFGTPDYISAPYDVTVREAYFALTRSVIPTTLPPLWSRSTGLEGPDSARVATSEFLSPGLHETTATFYDSRLPPGKRQEFVAKAAHMPTPETTNSTHYFIVDGRCFAMEDASITEFMHDQLLLAFREDVEGLEAVHRVLTTQPAEDLFELSFGSDRASIEMRKYLKKRAQAQQPIARSASADFETQA